jgi:hypothetical protein
VGNRPAYHTGHSYRLDLVIVIILPPFYQLFPPILNQVGLVASHTFNVVTLFNETALSISHTTLENLFHTKNIEGSGVYHKIII